MTTAARESEARVADVAFQVALAQIGAGTIEDALAVWRNLDPTNVQATTQGWLAKAIWLILGRRRMARDLAMAYYRLARALRTGKTVADPFHPDPDHVTLGDLRREFRDLVQEIEYVHTPSASETDANGSAGTERPTTDSGSSQDDSERIPVEEIPNLREQELDLEEAAEKAARDDLAMLGPDLLDSRTSNLDPETTLGDAEALVQEEAQKAAARVAASSERIVLNGGRGSVWKYGQSDSRVIGFARVSLSGDPCSFCAMLISRGFDFKTEASATKGKGVTIIDGQVLDAYHDNCRCVAIPIYSKAQYETDPRFDQNRALDKLWQKEIAGNWSGNDARNAWRRLIENGRRSGTAHWIVTPADSPYARAA